MFTYTINITVITIYSIKLCIILGHGGTFIQTTEWFDGVATGGSLKLTKVSSVAFKVYMYTEVPSFNRLGDSM